MHNQLSMKMTKITTAAVYISTLVSVITKQIEGFVSNKARAAVLLAFLQLQYEK